MTTIAFIAVPPREVLTRWRRTGPYLAVYAVFAAGIWLLGVPLLLAVLLAGPVMLLGLLAGSAIVIRWRCQDAWHVRDGRDAAVILLGHNRDPDRWVLHSWAAWRQGGGLGTAVAAAALRDAPRPLWLDPATPTLRELYLSRGGVEVDGGRWVVFR